MEVQKVRASRRKYHFLYKTTCLVTNKYYIGMHSTDDLNDEYLGSGIKLTHSVKKYGRENHTREILQQFSTREELVLAEGSIVTQDLVDSDLLCMNLMPGGSANNREFGVTDKTRKLLSEASKRAVRTKEWCDKISKAHTGKKMPEGFSEKMSKALTGKTLTDEHKAAIGNAHRGMKRSEETRKRISEGNKGKTRKGHPCSEATKQKLREANLGAKRSEETRAAMRAAKQNHRTNIG